MHPVGERRLRAARPPEAAPSASPFPVPSRETERDGDVEVGGTPSLPDGAASADLLSIEIGRALEIGPEGHFLPTGGAFAYFDQQIATGGGEPLSVVRGRVVIEIIGELDPPADAEAIEVLDRYIAYRSEEAEIIAARAEPLAPAEREALARNLRRKHLGDPVVRSAHAVEDREIVVDLERGRDRLDAVSYAPAREEGEVRTATRPREPVDRDGEAAQPAPRDAPAAHKTGASDSTVFDLWAARYGNKNQGGESGGPDEAVEDWKKRFARYRGERDALIESFVEMQPAERADELEKLRLRFFSISELPRIRALDARALARQGAPEA